MLLWLVAAVISVQEAAPAWEILPSAAKPGELILSKRTEFGILSNFAPTSFVLDGVRYASVEGFWQMMKFPESRNDIRYRCEDCVWRHSRQEVSQMSSFEAKRAGDEASKNMKKLGINWVSYRGRHLPYRVYDQGEHYDLIVRAMKAKLSQNAEVKRILLKTGKRILKPDHLQENPPPAWRYHEIWMKLRSEL